MKNKTFNKRVVACVVALALMVSCFLTAFAGSVIPYVGDKGDNTTSVKVTSNGGRVEWTFGSTSGFTTSQKVGTTALGSECTLQAVDTATRVFMYWLDSYCNRVYSYERTVKFKATSRVNLRAQFASVDDAKHFVSFVNYGGTVMKDGNGGSNTSYEIGTSISAPTDVKLPGFTFTGWSEDVATVSSDTGDHVLYPQYTVNDESYTVTLTDDTYASGGGTYSNFQTVNLKAQEKNGAGEDFSYWQTDDGTIISYDRNYSFRINYDVTLTAVFGASATPEPVIRISKIYPDKSDMKLTFYAERSVPEGYTVVAHGMLMSTGNVTEGQMTVANAGDTASSPVRKVYGTSNESCGTFSLAKALVASTTLVNARPFVICIDPDGNQVVAYGDMCSATTEGV